MRHVLAPLLGAGLVLAAAVPGHAKDLNHLLQGDYVFSGMDRCVTSPSGFNANLTPKGPVGFNTSSIEDIHTFNGDGTGSSTGHALTVVDGQSAPIRSDFSFDFTYDVAADGTVTISNGLLSGAFVGSPVTFTIDTSVFVGRIAQDGQSVALTSETPIVETETLSTGFVQPRICTRSRVMLKVKKDGN